MGAAPCGPTPSYNLAAPGTAAPVGTAIGMPAGAPCGTAYQPVFAQGLPMEGEPAYGPCVSTVAPYASASSIVWSGSAGALFLFRKNEAHKNFSYDSAIETNQLLDARNAQDLSLPGVQARLVRFNTCMMTGFEGLYWGLFPSETTAQTYATDVTGALNPILNFDQINYNGNPGNVYANAAVVHRLRGTSELHNVEINRLWGMPSCGCSPWRIQALAGFRYLNFNESLEFAADTVNSMITGTAGGTVLHDRLHQQPVRRPAWSVHGAFPRLPLVGTVLGERRRVRQRRRRDFAYLRRRGNGHG